MPQPFVPKDQRSVKDIPRALEARPACAVKIAALIAEWTRVEIAMANMFAAVTGRVEHTAADTVSHLNNAPAYAALKAIQNLNTRLSVVKAATEAILPEAKRTEFEALAKTLRKRAGERNDVVHGAWCITDELPNDVLLRIEDAHHRSSFVRYTAKDLDNIIERIIAARGAVQSFGWEWMWGRMDAEMEGLLAQSAPKPPPPRE